MKRIIATAIFAACAISAGAQSMYDAMNYSQNNYYGTARSMALGNAVTAVGGDLGTVGINPAGSAVAYYGQFTITPGFTIPSVKSTTSFGGGGEKSRTRFTMPNCAASMSFPTGNNSGLKNVTFSFAANQTNNYNMSAYSSWRNGANSKLAELATAAYGYDEAVLADYDAFYNSDVPWDVLAAYQSGMIGSYEKGEYGGYVGNTERIAPDGSYHYVPGELAQTSSVNRYGSKTDIMANVAFNYNDKFYFGINVGVPTIDYQYSEFFAEAPVNIEQFPIEFNEGNTYFRSGTYDYQYLADISGIYAKVGFIWLPTRNLRIGAAFQTPTMMTIRETWNYGCTTDYDNTRFNGDIYSPDGEYSYGLRTPYRFNAGAAFTFGQKGFISVDYEMADYSVMKFRDIYDDDPYYSPNDLFYDVNKTNRNFCGLAHQLRAGAEFKVTPAFALRAGYTIATSPERYWKNSLGNEVTADDYLSNFADYDKNLVTLVTPAYYGDLTQSFSLGFGYSSPGSFFADFAVRMTSYPSWDFSPYYDYYGYTSLGEYVDQKAPRINNSKNLIDAALTLGWRF